MNQFHTPSFGDEVFDLNDAIPTTTSPTDSQHQTASRRMLSLDHSTLNDDDIDYEAATKHLDTYETKPPLLAQTTQLVPQTQHTLAHQQQQQLNTCNANAPAKPLAPYALFFRDSVTPIKQQNPSCSLEEISAIVNALWNALAIEQKEKYNQRHEQDKREYARQLREYRQQTSDADQQQQQNVLDLNNSNNSTTTMATSGPNMQSMQSLPGANISTVMVGASPVEQSKVPEVVTAMSTPAPTSTPTPAPAPAPTAPQQQIQLLTEAAAVQKCTREHCNKPAIINPDWEDEYCSNECVVIHCRNVFNEWARSLKNAPT